MRSVILISVIAGAISVVACGSDSDEAPPDSVSGWPHTNPGADIYVDSVYFDTSWARVEVGNAADYASCTHREIQLVTAWSDTEVTFTLDKGSLPAGSAWAFVIDETDQVQSSMPITVQ